MPVLVAMAVVVGRGHVLEDAEAKSKLTRPDLLMSELCAELVLRCALWQSFCLDRSIGRVRLYENWFIAALRYTGRARLQRPDRFINRLEGMITFTRCAPVLPRVVMSDIKSDMFASLTKPRAD